MKFNSIVTLLDESDLIRESVDLNKYDGFGVTWRNQNMETLSATVNGETFDDVIQVCLINDGEQVDLYINNIARWKLTKYDLENVLTFSIS